MSPWDLEVFSRTLWMEARGEPDAGQRAVAHVIWNRFERAEGRLTLAGVCMADQQFSCWNAAKDDSNRERMNALSMDDPLLKKFRRMISETRVAEDPTGGATLYHAAWMSPRPAWALSPRVAFRCHIERHVFYREAAE